MCLPSGRLPWWGRLDEGELALEWLVEWWRLPAPTGRGRSRRRLVRHRVTEQRLLHGVPGHAATLPDRAEYVCKMPTVSRMFELGPFGVRRHVPASIR